MGRAELVLRAHGNRARQRSWGPGSCPQAGWEHGPTFPNSHPRPGTSSSPRSMLSESVERPCHYPGKEAGLGQLQSCLMNCPRRKMLILIGDVNVQLQACPAVTGQLPCRSTHVVCADADRFYELMRMGSLQVINSFRGYVPTFIADRSNGAPGTMIDFFCVRTEQADPEARLATVLADIPLKAHVNANFHRPIIATVPWRRPSFPDKASRCDPLSRFAIQQQLLARPELVGSFRAALGNLWYAQAGPHTWDTFLKQAWKQVAEKPEVTQPVLMWDQPKVKGT